MGLKKVIYYSLECDKCQRVAKDSKGVHLAIKKEAITEMAIKYGFVKKNKNTWLCPECAKKNEQNN